MTGLKTPLLRTGLASREIPMMQRGGRDRLRRPPVERGAAWLVAHGNRRLRYLGAVKNNAWLHTRAAALNLRTLVNLGLTRTDDAWPLVPAVA
ncbi:transposase [Streptosporangium roseum]